MKRKGVKYMRRITSSLLAVAIALSCNVLALAETGNIFETPEGLSTGESDMTYEVVKSSNYLVASIPLDMPIIINTDGEMTLPENLQIQNHTMEQLEVSNIKLKGSSSSFYIIDDTSKINELSSVSGMYFEFKDHNENVYKVNSTVEGYTTNSQPTFVDTSGWNIPAKEIVGFELNADCTERCYSALQDSYSTFCAVEFTIGYAENNG